MGKVETGMAENQPQESDPPAREAVAPVPVSVHERNLRAMPCILTGRPHVTLHHVRGGSIARLGWGVGVGQKQNPFLQIPLNGEFHVGKYGIDYGYGVETWELTFAPQVVLLQRVNSLLPYDVWEQALLWHAAFRRNTRPGQRPLTE